MILIVSKDKDFSHALAGQLVRELAVDCECATEMQGAAADLILTDEGLTHPRIPVMPITLPIRLSSLLLELRAKLSQHKSADIELSGGVVFSPRGREIRCKKQHCDLTDKETTLLEAIHAAGKNGISREMLLKEVWGIEAELNTHTLETHIYRLRSKIKELCGEELIVATDGGYRLGA